MTIHTPAPTAARPAKARRPRPEPRVFAASELNDVALWQAADQAEHVAGLLRRLADIQRMFVVAEAKQRGGWCILVLDDRDPSGKLDFVVTNRTIAGLIRRHDQPGQQVIRQFPIAKAA